MTDPDPRPTPSQVVRALFLVLFLALAACSHEPEGLPNVKLGMSPRDVRERFAPGGEGAWSTRVSPDDDTVLEWTASSAAATLEHATFEFHNGMLVAVRATSRASQPQAIEATKRTVLVREGTHLTLLARDCPTHKPEAEALAARAAHAK